MALNTCSFTCLDEAVSLDVVVIQAFFGLTGLKKLDLLKSISAKNCMLFSLKMKANTTERFLQSQISLYHNLVLYVYLALNRLAVEIKFVFLQK